jgi:uncharacterized membrane protein
MLIKSPWRRPVAVVLIVIGAVMIALVPDLRAGGLLLLALGLLIEVVGVTLKT